MKYVLRATLVLSVVLFGALPVYAAADAKQLISEAESKLKQAGELGFEWTQTGGLIKDAKAALAKGDNKLAEKLAAKALKQAENSVIQGKYAESHWQELIP